MPEVSIESAPGGLADASFKRQMIDILPELQRYARNLAGDCDYVYDLVQETSIRALVNHASFKRGTNLRAWMFTICRNIHYARWHKEKRFTEWQPWLDETLEASGGQEASAALSQMVGRMERLPVPQRDALALIAVGGCTYEEAAELENCAIGTMKSRVSRARESLEHIRAKRPTGSTRGFDSLLNLCMGLLDRDPGRASPGDSSGADEAPSDDIAYSR